MLLTHLECVFIVGEQEKRLTEFCFELQRRLAIAPLRPLVTVAIMLGLVSRVGVAPNGARSVLGSMLTFVAVMF